MMSSSVTEANLEKKFRSVTNTQDCIQTLSLWILHHKAHHQKIVSYWMKVLQKAKISHRLTLFYLANDVVQNGKRKGITQYGNTFAEILREATLLVRNEQIRPSIERVFNIWEQRGIYDAQFISDLKAILANTKVPASAPSKLLTEFKHEVVVEKLRSVVKLHGETRSKLATINLSKLNATNAEIVQQLKDRMHGQQFSREFEDSTHALEELITSISREMKERTDLILLLEKSEIYYDTQRGEAKIVANAYKNFSGRVKVLQKKLEELTSTFPSPIPSPCPDAPSPTNSDVELELNLPNEKGQSGMTSWLDTFASKKKPVNISKTESKKSDSSSLDSRLSNLLQNMPNLPSSIQNSLFGSETPESTTNSLTNSKREKVTDVPFSSDIMTSIKDEYSGQNTPLQDEDNQSSSNHAAFFSRNTAQHPNNVLKVLTGDTDERHRSDNTRKNNSAYSIPLPFQNTNITVLTDTKHHQNSTSYYNSPQHLAPPTMVQAPTSGNSMSHLYQHSSYNNASSYSANPSADIQEHLSFIPALVPSPQNKDPFQFPITDFPLDEYNPEIQNFDMDMDIEGVGLSPDLDVPSPEADNEDRLSPEPEMNQSRSSGRRQSTLITVVTKDTEDEIKLPADVPFPSDIPSGTQEGAIPALGSNSTSSKDTSDAPTQKIDSEKPSAVVESAKDIDERMPFFSKALLQPPPPPPKMSEPANEKSSDTNSKSPVTKTQPVENPRKEMPKPQFKNNNNNNDNNNWIDFEMERHDSFFDNAHHPPYDLPQQHRAFEDERNFHFHNRNNWPRRGRPAIHFLRGHPYGPPPPPPPPKRFSFRGRGWGRRQPQY